LPLQQHGFVSQAYPTPSSLCRRDWPGPLLKGFSRINTLKEKIIYFYCLCNCLPAFGNDSQNGIHCCQQAAMKYYLH
jgi:hypothetical protein